MILLDRPLKYIINFHSNVNKILKNKPTPPERNKKKKKAPTKHHFKQTKTVRFIDQQRRRACVYRRLSSCDVCSLSRAT